MKGYAEKHIDEIINDREFYVLFNIWGCDPSDLTDGEKENLEEQLKREKDVIIWLLSKL